MSSSNSTKVINPNSVQSQFQSLADQKTQLEAQIRQANADRLTETQKCNRIRSSMQHLSERIRVASSNSGVQEKKRTMLQQQVKQLNTNLQNDYQQLTSSSRELDALKQKEMELKKQYVHEMDLVNKDMMDALSKFQDSTLVSKIDAETALVIQQHFNLKLEQLTNGSFMTLNQEEKKKVIKVCKNISSLVDSLQETSIKCKAQQMQNQEYANRALYLRRLVQNQNNEALAEEELDSLEQVWQEVDLDQDVYMDMDHVDGVADVPTNVSLFYGNSSSIGHHAE